MGKKKKAIMTLIEALVLISLAGCAGKKVDYGVDTEVKSQNVVSSVKDCGATWLRKALSSQHL